MKPKCLTENGENKMPTANERHGSDCIAQTHTHEELCKIIARNERRSCDDAATLVFTRHRHQPFYMVSTHAHDILTIYNCQARVCSVSTYTIFGKMPDNEHTTDDIVEIGCNSRPSSYVKALAAGVTPPFCTQCLCVNAAAMCYVECAFLFLSTSLHSIRDILAQHTSRL